MFTPLPHQIEGARFLADRRRALLADEPRVGKTGAAIMAADMVGANRILVVTTASGRPVWRKGFNDWSLFGRPLQVLSGKAALLDSTDVAIVGWPDMRGDSQHFQAVMLREWDAIIFDEAHYAKDMSALRTQAVFGLTGLHTRGEYVWALTGTPMPNSPFDLYPMLAAMAPERLRHPEVDGFDLTHPDSFKARYCNVRRKKISAWNWIDVIVGGKNLDELAQRLDGFYLLRTQQDVGITEPIYDILPLAPSPAALKKAREAERSLSDDHILEKIETGAIDDLRDHHLGPVRRIWGELKVGPLVAAIKEELDDGLDKVVIACWHTDVIAAYAEALAKYGVTGVDGATSTKAREANVKQFQTDPKTRVFIGQIQAAGEAIDLSASAELIFAEASFVPKDMKQMALRITNHGQTRRPRVRVAVLEGSIDEALQTVLMRKWATINEVLKK